MIPEKAFILAAGFGKRLRPYTDEVPKPMVKVHEKPMIDQALDKLGEIGVKQCVVNTHYKADILHEHLSARQTPEIILSHEPEILDTGGGIKAAIKNFKAPFFVLSGDSVWEDAPSDNTLQTLTRHWDAKKMDILFLLQPVKDMKLTRGVGDYDLDADGRATRSADQTGAYMFTSIRINAPEIFKSAPEQPFSYLDLLDQAEKAGRLYGLVHKGMWHHISTPEDLEAVNKALNPEQSQ